VGVAWSWMVVQGGPRYEEGGGRGAAGRSRRWCEIVYSALRSNKKVGKRSAQHQWTRAARRGHILDAELSSRALRHHRVDTPIHGSTDADVRAGAIPDSHLNTPMHKSQQRAESAEAPAVAARTLRARAVPSGGRRAARRAIGHPTRVSRGCATAPRACSPCAVPVRGQACPAASHCPLHALKQCGVALSAPRLGANIFAAFRVVAGILMLNRSSSLLGSLTGPSKQIVSQRLF
jgi:hypothetical protein